MVDGINNEAMSGNGEKERNAAPRSQQLRGKPRKTNQTKQSTFIAEKKAMKKLI